MKQKISNIMQSIISTDAKETKSSPSNMKLLTEVIDWVARDAPDEKEELRKWLTSGNLKRGSQYQMNVKHKLQLMLPLLLQNGNDVKLTDKNNRTLLHFCVFALRNLNARGDWERIHEWGLISRLCEFGASIIADDCNGDSPLGIALVKQRLDLVSILLRFVCDSINETNGLGQTVLHILIGKYSNGSDSHKAYVKFIRHLMDKGADVNIPDKNGVTPLHLVVKSMDFELLKLLKNNGGDSSCLTNSGDNMLIVACKSITEETDEPTALELIDSLLNSGFAADCKNNKGFTPLHYASSGKSLAITKNLIQAGANVHAVAADNTNPLHSATISPNLEVMKRLIDAGVDVDRRDDTYGFSLIHMAAMSDDEGKCERLIQKFGLQPNDRGKCDVTPLLVAAMIGNARVVAKLIEYGADVHCTDSRFRYTALHLAAMRGRFASIREICRTSPKDDSSSLVGHCFSSLGFGKKSKIGSRSAVLALLKAGADVNARDAHGRTPLHYATRQPNNELVEVLMENGAHVDAQDNDCFTPLHNCLLNNNELGLKHLLLHGANVNDVEPIRSRILTQIRKPDNLYGPRLVQHLVKLEVADLYVDDAYRRYLGKPNWKEFYAKCVEESAKLKEQMVTPEITVYDLLHVNFRRRSSFVNGLPTNLEAEVPYYSTLIKNKCHEAANRNQLIEPAKLAYQTITELCWPDVCLEHILSFLNNSTLRVLIDSAKVDT